MKTLDVVMGPDVYVNASVAQGSPPDKALSRIVTDYAGQAKATPWIVERIRGMFEQHPHFKKESIDAQVDLIKKFIVLVDDADHPAHAWEQALISAARTAGVKRILTDHPDLLDRGSVGAIDFICTEAWLLEQALPPPPPA